MIYSSSSSSSYSSSSSSYSSSPPASSAASSSPSFFPGRTPHHLGSLALGLLFHSPSFSFHIVSKLGTDDIGSTLVELLSVAVGTGVRSPLVLGEHVNFGGMGATEGLGVESLLDGFVSQLELSSLIEFLKLVVLVNPSLFIVVFVGFKFNNGVPDGVSLGSELIRVHGFKGKGFNSDTK